jgi:HEAT repeat protein
MMVGTSHRSSLVLLLLLLVGIVIPVLGTDVSAQENQALFEEGRQLYLRGEREAALAKFRQVLASNPGHEDAMWMRDQLSWRTWGEMLKDGEGRAVASRILELATLADRAMVADEAAIRGLVAELRSPDFGVRSRARRTLAGIHGAHAVPYLVPALGDAGDDDFRVEAAYTLKLMGKQAVLPLMEALRSDNALLVANACSVLGGIGDRRALPALAAAAEGADSSVARDRALEAIEAVGGRMPGSVSQLFADLALAYAGGDPSVLADMSGTKRVWSWTGDNVAAVEVPSFLQPLLLAEHFAATSVSLDSSNLEGWKVLTRSWIAQGAAVDARMSGGADDTATLAAALSRTATLASGAGPEVLDAVLAQAIQDGDVAVASRASEHLGAILADSGHDVPSLHQALGHPAKLVRFSAAIALGHIHGRGGFPGAEQVGAELLRVLAEPGLRSVLVISGSDELRNTLLATLGRAGEGLFAVGAKSGLDGLARAKSFPPADAIVCDSRLTDITTDKVLAELAGDYRTAEIPVLILSRAKDKTEAQNLYSSGAAGFLVHQGDEQQTLSTVTGAITRDASVARGRALDLATRAANALAHLTRDPAFVTGMDAAAQSGLLRALSLEDAVRVPACEVAGRLGATQAVTALTAILANAGNASEARSAAAIALGRIAATGFELPADAGAALGQAAAGDDVEVSRACGVALGLSGFDAGTRAAILEQLRLDPAQVFSTSQ